MANLFICPHKLLSSARRHLSPTLLCGVAAFVFLAGAIGCRPQAAAPSADERPLVVATTTMLADITRAVAGDAFRVEGIMSPGGDPHLYQPTPSDAHRVSRSALVVVNGLHLEGWSHDLVENAGGSRPVVDVGATIDPIHMADSPGGVDPHFWFDVAAWSGGADVIAEGLIALTDDAEVQAALRSRRDALRAELAALHAWVGATLSTIPEAHRVLITSHDAFNYLERAYGLPVVGIQGISTEQEASQRDVARVVELVRDRGAPAVFVETSVNPTMIQQVARETGVAVAGPLYSDSTGPADSPAGTYQGMVVENVRMITEGLGGAYTPFGGPP